MGIRTPALACTGLVKRFGRAVALAGVDLTVERGAVVGLVGPNGSGKTTALRIAAGIARPDAGGVHVDGLPGGSLAARARTGYVPDEPTGLDELTVAEYLDLVAAVYRGGASYAERADGLLRGFRLADRRASRLGSLSHGLRRSAAIVAALALKPVLAVVDEASAALDPTAAAALADALRALAAGGSGVLLASQDLDFARAACDEVALLADGRIAERGSPAAVLAGFGRDSLDRELLAALGSVA